MLVLYLHPLTSRRTRQRNSGSPPLLLEILPLSTSGARGNANLGMVSRQGLRTETS